MYIPSPKHLSGLGYTVHLIDRDLQSVTTTPMHFLRVVAQVNTVLIRQFAADFTERKMTFQQKGVG